jgi:hypothetical protein
MPFECALSTNVICVSPSEVDQPGVCIFPGPGTVDRTTNRQVRVSAINSLRQHRTTKTTSTRNDRSIKHHEPVGKVAIQKTVPNPITIRSYVCFNS